MLDLLSQKPLLKNLAICMSCALAASILFYHISESYIISQAEKNIQNLLLSHKGIHLYVQKRMLPALYEYKDEQKIPEEFYAPELFSSSYIVRNQHAYYNQELSDAGFPQLYYKLAANNPRNPINKADALEKELIVTFNNDRSVKKYREIITLDGEEYLYFAIPFLENTKPCMVCHGKREEAPQELQEKYPGEGGFNEHIGEIRAITSIRAPMHREHHQLYIIVSSLATGTFALFFLTFFNSRLRTKVRRSTQSLEMEINEKQALASKLLESENYLKSIQESMQVGLFLIDRRTYKIVDVNKAALQLIGLPRSEVIGRQCFHFVCPAEQVACSINDQNQAIDKSEQVLINTKGIEVPVLKTATKIRIFAKDYILETFIDISEQKKIEKDRLLLESQLNQAQKMESVGRLAGGVAHDFNNMLGVISGHAEIAMDQLDSEHPVFDNLQQILRAAERSADITRQLLAFARKQVVAPKVIDLNNTVEGMLKMLLRLIGEDINLVWLPEKGLWPINVDPAQIDQVLVNLCVNARDAIEGVGKITVETRNCLLDEEYCSVHASFMPGEYVRIDVSDNGGGMDKETVAHIFEPFFTTKDVSKGTGLGLATVYGIIKQNSGFINVYSEPGKGTTFTIYLPRYVGPTEETYKDIRAGQTSGGNETILLVEDEPTLLDMTASMLQRLGYNVLAAGSPGEAMNLAEHHKSEIHLVLTDVIMPEMNGRILMEKLISSRPGLKHVFMSGYTANVISPHGILEDGVWFLQKPFTKRELAAKIRQALGDQE